MDDEAITYLTIVRVSWRASASGGSLHVREVLGLVGAGHSNAEIGRRLHLVEGTVKAYVSSVLERLEVRNRVQ